MARLLAAMINDYEEYILCYVKTFVYSLLIYHFILRSLFSFTYDYLYPSGCDTYCYSGDYATLTIADSTHLLKQPFVYYLHLTLCTVCCLWDTQLYYLATHCLNQDQATTVVGLRIILCSYYHVTLFKYYCNVIYLYIVVNIYVCSFSCYRFTSFM